MSLSHDIAILVAWIRSDCLEINNSNVQFKQSKLLVKKLDGIMKAGIVPHEDINSRNNGIKIKKHTRSVFCSTSPLRNHQGRNPESEGDFFRGSDWTEYLTRWFLLLYNGQWRGALMLSLICAWINGWVNNSEAGDLRWHRAHLYATVISNAQNSSTSRQWKRLYYNALQNIYKVDSHTLLNTPICNSPLP